MIQDMIDSLIGGNADLSDADSPFEFAVPAPEQFAAAMSALGVSDGSRVVLYDRMMSMWAARVWWMLRWIGFDDAALLDGGLAAWEAAGGTLVDEVPVPEPGRLTIDLRPHLIVDQDQVKAAIDDPAVALVDSLTPELYRGEMPMYHDRAGHIPSAGNVSALALVDETGRFVGLDDLAELHDGYDRQARTITYCGGGIAASAGAFAMTRLGFSDVAVYAASLQEWAGDPSNPLVIGGD